MRNKFRTPIIRRSATAQLDWKRLLRRFGPNWRVLLAQLVMFGFIYPSERERIPSWVMQDLMRRLQASMSASPPQRRLCRGTLLSRQQYLIDVEQWGYLDARALDDNPMSDDDIATWTSAIADDGSKET